MTTVMSATSEIKILVVDDTPDNLRLLAKILEAQNYTVFKSLNGKMALQAAHRNPPDLILLDINMPNLNGYQVCQQLKASEVTANIPVIFISAMNQASDKVRAFELGGQDYITKPFQEAEVLARVKNQILIHQQKRQLQQEIETRQQAEAKIWRLNADLERQVHKRTLELQQSLSFEVALKSISDQVRDSLDQHKILQASVETLAKALEVDCCHAALYRATHSTPMMRYQWVRPGAQFMSGQVLHPSDFPGLYDQLQQRMAFTFCQPQLDAAVHPSAILACPIFDDQVDEIGILGELWLFRDIHSSFGAMEMNLVQQVANQCAIALRQARLYEAAQAQVQELQRLNQLKDDFLNTISHELRTPIASMKMVLNLLTTLIQEPQDLAEPASVASIRDIKIVQYLQVLEEECDRELALVEDILSLQHIEAGIYTVQPTPLYLQDFIPHLIEPFEARAQNQQQKLEISIAPNLPSLNLDPKSITRIMTELLTNACKYTPANETISVSVMMSHMKISTHLVDCVQFVVTNTGTEIKAKELTCIFDKFYRIPSNDPWKHGGTGLGLALVKKLVEQMNGQISVESTAALTMFTIQIPVEW
ncbi:response regulator [Leptolyngbya sp. AN02str]|uniref:hybrid sensor histidine kinase/response regulator n=1 Tax=Leptolyngbya sp. AN02str TaxID=3423363 RepID=UPI003D3146EA